MSSSDYTTLRRIKHMSKPTSCNDHHSKPNCYYVNGNNQHCKQHNNEHCKQDNEDVYLINNNLHCDHHAPVVLINNTHHQEEPVYLIKNRQHEQVYLINDNTQLEMPGHQNKDKYITFSTKKYIITPINDGSVTFTIDNNLTHNTGYKVVCTNTVAEYNYFEGEIFDYNKTTGEITIFKIQNVNGDFKNPATYNITLSSGNQELIKTKNRVNDLYEYLFKVDLTNPINNKYDLLLIQYYNQIRRLYKYFFNIDIAVINYEDYEDDNEITEQYLTKKINYLYFVFFNIKDLDLCLKRFKDFNPNNNGVLLNTIKHKISQLYVYFFNIEPEI